VATTWVTNKYPQGQPACSGVGYPGALYYDRRDCGFGWVAVSDTAQGDVVKVAFITSDGVTQGAPVTTTWRGSPDFAWQFSFMPGATWPAGPVTIRVVEVKGVSGNFGETQLNLNALGATVGVSGSAPAPGSPFSVTGTTFEIDQVPPLAGNQTTAVGAAFKLQVVWPDGTIRGPYGPFTANPGPLNTGTFSATIPGAATAGLTADASTNYRATIAVEAIDATYTDTTPAVGTGAWAASRAGAGSVSFVLPPSTLLVEDSFVSAVGWVKPGETYPFRLLVRNYTTTARAGASVTVPVPDGTAFTSATATGGSGACSVNASGGITWTIGAVAAAIGGTPAIKTCVVVARADTLAQDGQIVWKNLSSTATLSYTGGPAGLTSTSHGPKVIPPAETFDSARYGDRPFPVVPVDWHDRRHEPAHTGDALSDKLNSPSIAGSTFNLYQEMSYGQLYPDADVPSAGVASAGWGYGPGFQFTTPMPGGTCAGVTYSAAQNTPLYPERIVDGWYQMPGDTGYYGSDGDGSALIGAEAGVAQLQMIDNGCGPTGKAVYDAAQIADPEIDYSDFDTDKDGVVDFFMMVFAGVGGHGASQTSVPPYDNIWPHSSSLESGYSNQGPYKQTGYVSDDQLKDLEGFPLYYTSVAATQMTRTVTAFPVYVRVGPYNVNPEDAIDHASVISHEYGHSLGLPDFYSIGSRSTYGDWNLMGNDKSQNMDVYSKQELGWIVPRVLSQGGSDVSGWQDSKRNTHQITWQQPDGTSYTLSGAGVANGEAYVAKLPTKAILDPSKFDAAGPGVGASRDHAWWSKSGNDFGCAPVGGNSLDIYLPELENLAPGTPVTLTFKSLWDMEWDFDYGFVMLSTDDGVSYTSLPSANNYTNPAAINPQNNGCQSQYGNGITGTSGSYEAGTQNIDRVTPDAYPDGGFLADQYDLSAAVGSRAVLRFSYSTDPGVSHPGWFIDDIRITAGSQVIFDGDGESAGDPSDPRVFNGGCKDSGKVAAQCTKGWQFVNSAVGSPADHAYYLELRDRSGFDADSHGQSDRGEIGWSPGVLLTYTDETHGYGNYGTPDPPAVSPLDSHPTPGSNTPNLNDAAFTAAAGSNHFSDAGAGWTDNYLDPSSADGNWHFANDCLTFDVLGTAGLDVGPVSVPPYNIGANVHFTIGSGCARFDYGHGGSGGPVNAPPTAVADARPLTINAGEPVTFDGSNSSDDRQAPNELAYAWDLDGNGSFETPGQVVTGTYGTAGDHAATLRVTDGDGLSSTDTVTIHVNGVDPCPPFTATGSYQTTFDAVPAGWSVNTAVNNVPTSLPWDLRPDPLAHTGTSSYSSDATTLDLKDDRLVSPAFALSSQSQLTFWHRYGFEAGFDGGVLEVSEDGAGWHDVTDDGGSFAMGGYDGPISNEYGSPIAGRSAWTNIDPTTMPAAMTKVVVNVGAFAGDNVRFRFRLGADAIAVPGSLPGAGWWIDDVSVSKLVVATTCSNNAPFANDDEATTTTGTPVTINVLGNDGDPDGDTVSVSSVGAAGHGSVADNHDGTVTYTAATGYEGPDSFDYTIGDGRGGSDTGTVSVTVTGAANRAPVANDDAGTTVESQPATIDVLGNDTDPDGDALLVAAVSAPARGTAVSNGDGTITYTPDAGYVGSDGFTYTASDGRGGTDTAAVSITVTQAPNRPPNAVNDSVSTTRDVAVRINVVANDSDPDGNSLFVSSAGDAPHGTTVDNGDGTITYTPDAGFTGTDSFSYAITDGHGGSDTAAVTVTVVAPSDTKKVNGSGWFTQAGAKSSFSVNATKAKNGAANGKVSFDRTGGISLKGTVTGLQVSGRAASLTGTCTLANGTSCTFTIDVGDVAEPGGGFDTFLIRVYDSSGAVVFEAADTIDGGNVQVH
jgi:immune inhibitor A